MFSKHPKGLIAAALANMGERFGFYIMMAILTLFISAKFGLSETTTGYIYSAFYASIYILALAGGVIADKTKNFKGTILVGLIYTFSSFRAERSGAPDARKNTRLREYFDDAAHKAQPQ